MNKKIIVSFAAIIMLAAAALGCDPKGALSKQETQALYEELRTEFQDESVWDMDIDMPDQMLKNDDGLTILKAAVDAFLEGSEDGPADGVWFSSKKYSRSCSIKCGVSVECSGKVYTIKEVRIAKYSGKQTSYKYMVCINLAGFAENNRDRYITVLFYK